MKRPLENIINALRAEKRYVNGVGQVSGALNGIWCKFSIRGGGAKLGALKVGNFSVGYRQMMRLAVMY